MMTLSQIANIVGGTLIGQNRNVDSFSTDSRTLNYGDVFIALKGDLFNGMDFLEQAIQMGASAAIVDQETEANIPLLIVDNALQAMQVLAKEWREEFPATVIAVTGSCGKTTTRAMTESILSLQGPTLASLKNYNNHIGVPLTLLRLADKYEFAVVEMGMNHANEITTLSQMAEPNVAVVTCVAPVHLEALGTLDNIAQAKAEIFDGLKNDGTVIVNNDDAFADYFKKITSDKKHISFGIEKTADIMARDIKLDATSRPNFKLITPQDEAIIQLPLMGAHNVYNALAAAAIAVSQAVPFAKIKQGLESVIAVDQRLVQKPGLHGAAIIDDSYNANPTSVRAAIQILAAQPGESILVLGDMLELGENKERYHAEIGEVARAAGISHLFCYGPLSLASAKTFGANAQHFSQQTELIAALKPLLNKDVTLLVKGSGGMKMNKIVQALMPNEV